MTAIQERPVAWAVNHAHGTTVWDSETKARKVADEWLASGVWIWAEVVPLYRQPRWIPVSERLPPESEGVVVWDSENRIAAVAYRWVSVIDGKSNYTMTAGDGYGFSEYAVTHWMPLPEPVNCATQPR